MAKAKVILAPGEVVIPDQENPKQDVIVRRRASTIERLVSTGTLRVRHKLAAEKLYFAYVVGQGVAAEEPTGLPSSIPGWMMANLSDRQLEALKEYKDAEKALGPSQAQAVIPIVLYDLTVDELARSLQMRKQRAFGYLKAGMDRLADHYNIALDAVEKPLTVGTGSR